MERKRVLFLIEAVTAAHLVRCLPLAQSLSRKFKVSLASLNPPPFLVTEYKDIEFLPLTTTVPPSLFLESLYQGQFPYDEEQLRKQRLEDLEIINIVQPDLVVIDFRLSACFSAELIGIPVVNLQNAYWSPEYSRWSPVPDSPTSRFLGPSLLGLFEQGLWNRTQIFERMALRRLLKPFNKLRKELKQTPFGSLRELYSFGSLLVHPDPMELIENGSSWKSVFLGPITKVPKLPRPQWMDELDPQKKTVLLSMGSSGRSENLLRSLPELLQGPHQWILISNDERILRLRAKNVFTDRFVPLLEVVPFLDLAVLNGGSAQGYFCLSQGIPILGIPSNMDQHLFTQLIAKQDLGLSMRSEAVSPQALRALIQKGLEDEPLKKRVQAFAKRLESYTPEENFLRAIEKLLDSNHPLVESEGARL